MELPIEQVEALAPDASSKANGKKLSSPTKWSFLGHDEIALWGGCQGSGSKVYQIRIQLSDLSYKCNCPSRKFPCKHVLGLLMLAAQHPDSVDQSDRPEWVTEWIEAKQQREQKKLEKAKQPKKSVDKVAQKKRQDKREENIFAGLEQTELWLADLIRNGIAVLEGVPFSYWDEQAKRLVDAQAPGLASRVKRIGEMIFAGGDWTERVLKQLGLIQLGIHAYKRKEFLSDSQRADLRQWIGWNVTQDDLIEHRDLVEDNWSVLGQRHEEVDNLTMQRTWLVGQFSKRIAMIIQFAHSSGHFAEQFLPGTTQEGTLTFYPGVKNLRARFLEKKDAPVTMIDLRHSADSCETFLQSVAQDWSHSPWQDRHLCVLDNVTLEKQNENWFCVDQNNRGLPLTNTFPAKIQSISGGQAISFIGEWDGFELSPLSVVSQDHLFAIS
jgi:hypothetical protein